MIDSTYIKIQRAAFSVKGGVAIGRSRGGWITKIYAFTDVIGRPDALMLTPGKVSEINVAPAVLEQTGVTRYLLGDEGYGADSLRRSL